jgi:hypothetical protein
MSTLIYFAAFICAFIWISRRLWNLTSQLQAAQPGRPAGSGDERVSDPHLCRQLIEGKLTQGSKSNRLSLLHSRAVPNGRLRTAFAINNAFTSSDTALVQGFVREARRRIKLKTEEWPELTPMLVDTARRWILVGFATGGLESGSRDRGLINQPGIFCSVKLNITSLVQALTLKAILATVLKAETKECPSDLDILLLAQQINRGWIQSKKDIWAGGDSTGMLNFEDNGPLKASLNAVFSQAEHGENPLNFLLPSFETMWRVVLRALLELKFQSGRENPEWAKGIMSFCRDVTKAGFERRPSLRAGPKTTAVIEGDSQFNHAETPSARDIVMEALRMYPPTRRIYRAYEWDDPSASGEPGPVCDPDVPSRMQHQTAAADIEACHLRTDIWGSNAANFDPTRWMNTTLAQNHAFMPFGYGVCECPAKAVFGPWMIAILVGALLSALDDDDGWTLWCADHHVMRRLATKERLRLERDAYDNLEVIR